MPYGLGSWSSSPMDSGVSPCSKRNGQIFPLSLPNVTLPPEAVKADGSQGSGEEGKVRSSVRIPAHGRGSRGRATGCPFRVPCNLGAVVSKIVLEPERKRIRLALDAPVDVVERPVRDVGDLSGVGLRLGLQPSEIDVDELVFMHAVAELGLVAGEKAERQFACYAEFFAEPAARREHRPLARARMAAAGIRPKPARVILLRTALLQHDPPVPVHHENRKGAMQKAFAVDGCLATGAGGAVALID